MALSNRQLSSRNEYLVAEIVDMVVHILSPQIIVNEKKTPFFFIIWHEM